MTDQPPLDQGLIERHLALQATQNPLLRPIDDDGESRQRLLGNATRNLQQLARIAYAEDMRLFREQGQVMAELNPINYDVPSPELARLATAITRTAVEGRFNRQTMRVPTPTHHPDGTPVEITWPEATDGIANDPFPEGEDRPF